MIYQIQKTIASLRRIYQYRFDKSDIETVDALIEFIHTRSAYIAQTSLYGYLKTRMGRDYIKIFKDEDFAPSLSTAKWQIFAACLSDLSVYSVAKLGLTDPSQNVRCAIHCHRISVLKTFKGETAERMKNKVVQDFNIRCEAIIWANAAIGASALSLSPLALANCSPVSDEFKELDQEVVMNSVRFRWSNICDELINRLNGEAVWHQWQQQYRDKYSDSQLETSKRSNQ